ncbi:sulfurtransferase TusA family protein [Clostridium akagii]|uniref:sulfurtransferase TusA family protein n=1 Tax=Clostridium akagii TaxID=91623 RepID=UPI0004788111|nr:sulfurtransferase TusA family protein [Clostridium akagii]
MIEIRDEHFAAVEDFKNKAGEYVSGKLDPLRFKAFRVAMGIYEQRKKETYMVRTRIPGGVINKDQFKLVSELSKKYSSGKLHLTSRQDIQFQNVELKNVYTIMKELIEKGITTKGTGGNTVRNVECSPLSGVSHDEIFDVTPYVKVATDYLIKDPSTMNLPRKYKIGFSNSKEDTANATISDLGFIAKIQNAIKGFEIYAGGGFGANPRVSLKLSDFSPDTDILYYIQGLKELFEKEGDRTNKNKARIRYIVARLGEEKFLEELKGYVAKVKNRINLDVIIESTLEEINPKEEKIEKGYENIIFAEKQDGYYSIYVHAQSGNLRAESLDSVITFVESLDYGVTLRVTNTQGFFVRSLKGEDAKKLADIVLKFASPFNIDNSLTCAGASTCQLGLCLSQSLLIAIKEKFKNASYEVKDALPRLFISGCQNSCGQHEKGKIGLSGKAVRTQDGLMPMYSVFLGGKVGSGGAKMGELFGVVPVKKIPQYLLELAQLKVKLGYECFDKFIEEKSQDIKDLIEKNSLVESFSENPDFYYDFGADEKFTLKGRGAGECSTGVLDVIKLDISNAEGSLSLYKDNKDNDVLYASALSSARTLLVLKGIDSNKDREIFKGFKSNFIDTGYVKPEISVLFDSLIDYKLGDISDISSYADDITYLLEKVKAMYESLNGQLEITLPKELKDEETQEKKEQEKVDIVDFRGVQCPINFVKVKIELSKIKSGEKKGFYLDDGAPIENVPKSVEKEGHKIISIDENYKGYNLLTIEKK